MIRMENLFLMIFQMEITAAPVILGVFLARWFMRRAPKRYSYILWAVVGLRLVFPFSVSSVFSLFNLHFFRRAGVGKNLVQPVLGEVSGTQAMAVPETGRELVHTAVGNMSISRIQPQAGGDVWQHLLRAGTVLWAAGMAVCLLYFLVSWIRVKRNVKKAVHWKENIWECENVGSPFVMGIFRPRIYIPFHLDDFQKKMLLLHEKCHIRRKDYLVKLFAYLLAAVYWFYPLVWISYFAMIRDMEMSCDEWVLKCLGSDGKKEYSRLLLAFAQKEPAGRQAGVLGFGENITKSRIKNVLNFKHFGRWGTGAKVVLCIAVAVFLGTNGTEKETVPENMETEIVPEMVSEVQSGAYDGLAETLYALKNPYVGDASTDGKLFQAICEAEQLTDSFWNSYVMSLETDEEPYRMQIEFSQVPEDPVAAEIHMADCGNLLLALIDNLSEVQFIYPEEIHEKGNSICIYWDLEAAKTNLRGNDVKKYGESQDSLEELLAMLNDGQQREISAVRSEEIEEGSNEAPQIVEDDYVSYILQADVSEEESFMLPVLELNKKEHIFSFSYDLLSSYLSIGTYEIEKDILTAITNDGLYHYQFKVIDEDTLEFIKESSSEVKLLNEEIGVAVKDGAKFERRMR